MLVVLIHETALQRTGKGNKRGGESGAPSGKYVAVGIRAGQDEGDAENAALQQYVKHGLAVDCDGMASVRKQGYCSILPTCFRPIELRHP